MKRAASRESSASGADNGGDAAPRERSGEKLERLLGTAAALMARQGYDQTSIRDVGRETGYSLAGMYYYFASKEDLLFQIQQRTFASLLAEQEREVKRGQTPEEKLEFLVRNYLDFFTRHANELKICAFEIESVKGEQYGEIERLRRRYFRLAHGVVRELMGGNGRGAAASSHVRHFTLFIFGMLNWVFLWHDPRRDGSATRLADDMLRLILNGLPREGAAEDRTGT